MGFFHSAGFFFLILSVAVDCFFGDFLVTPTTSMSDSPTFARQKMLLIETDSVVEPFTSTPARVSPSDQTFLSWVSSLTTFGWRSRYSIVLTEIWFESSI